MPQDNMGTEQTPGRPIDVQDRRPLSMDFTSPGNGFDQAAQPSLTPEQLLQLHKHRGTFADIRSLLSRTERRRRIEERTHGVEDLFGADVERIARLDFVQSAIESSAIDTGSSHQNFPTPEYLLTAYATKPDGKKRGFKEDVRLLVERGIKRTLGRLTSETKTLYMDRGENTEVAEKQTEQFAEPVIKGKRKHFGLLGKDEQMRIVNNALDLRNGLLRGNMDHYTYYLSAYQEAAGLSDEQIAQKREEFATANEEGQILMAAEARRSALTAVSQTFTANLDRLRGFELEEGKNPKAVDKEMEDLIHSFGRASLPQRGRMVERVLDRKIRLALPYLDEITRLRRLLERKNPQESNPRELIIDLGNMQNGEQQRLTAEVGQIDALIRTKLKLRGFSTNKGWTNSPYGETVDRMEKVVADLARLHEDPSLAQTFRRVQLLRTTASDFFDF